MPGENGMVKVSNALRSRLRSNEHETEDRGYIERCFGRSLYSPDKLARIEQQLCTGNHPGCHLWFTKGASASDQLISADTQRLYEQAEDQAKLNRAAFARDLDLHQSALARLRAANSKLPARPPAARAHPRPSGLAGRDQGLARTGAARRPRIFAQRRGEPSRLCRRSDARRLGLAPALSGGYRHSGIYLSQKPRLLRHPRARDEFLQPARLHGAAHFEAILATKTANETFSITSPRAGTAMGSRAARASSSSPPPRKSICSSC